MKSTKQYLPLTLLAFTLFILSSFGFFRVGETQSEIKKTAGAFGSKTPAITYEKYAYVGLIGFEYIKYENGQYKANIGIRNPFE